MKLQQFMFPMLATLIILVTACIGGEQAQITLTAVDCPKDSVSLAVTTQTRQQGSAGNWVTTVSITVTCGMAAKPLGGAELRVETTWGTLKWVADASGKTTGRGTTHSSTSGQTVKVTIQGSDGEKVTSVTIT
jgi:hypothetical protein